MVRTDQFKYCVDHHGNELLHDIVRDPSEIESLAEHQKHKATLEQMRQLLLRRWFDSENRQPTPTGP